MKVMSFGKIIRKGLLYLGLALIGLAVITLAIVLSIRMGIVIPSRWLGLAFWTPALFWWITKPLKRHWRRPAFWGALIGLLVLHLLALTAVLLRYPRWPLVWFAPVSIVEAALFTVILIKLFDGGDHSRHSSLG